MSARTAGPEPPDVVDLTLKGSTPAPSQLLRDAKRVRLYLDPEAETGNEIFLLPGPATSGPYRSGVLLLLAYAAGPFAPLALRRGRRNGVWASIAFLCLLSWGAMIWRWPLIRAWLEAGTVPILPWMLWAFGSMLAYLTTWCRALHLVGRDARFVPQRLPAWVRDSTVAGALGLVFPGTGHLAAGHPRRAALALWNACCAVLMLLTLWHAGWMWRCNRAAESSAVPGIALEALFLFAAVLGSLGLLTWIGSSLDGARLIALRAAQRPSMRSDWIAFVLLCSILLAIALVRPANVARDIDRFATAMQHEDFRVIPLTLELAASRLDPAEPRYTMQVAELYDSFGKHEEAHRIRERMRERWEVYAEQLLREEPHAGQALLPLPIGPPVDPEEFPAADRNDTP
ncbi:MAG: hypothetical protein JSW67_14255 [Candidatus Latescibacterota bacterium]|nr:MAG: hypothetical protein JSW67_14255 [Candidatus Latescibacterota bacterium]